jgi:tripartite-type tricarboxylate transporter receptor subunit TctC
VPSSSRRTNVKRQIVALALAAVLANVSPPAWAQSYPTRPVRMIVGFAPGSGPDAIARLIAQKLSENLRFQFYVENVTGAGGNIAAARAAQAAPDGYTILVTAIDYVVNPALFDKIPYDPLKSFQPVTIAGSTNVLLIVNPSLPTQTARDLVALIKATPGKYSYASGGGIGSPGHLVGEQFRLSLGLDLVHVPFNGSSFAVGSVLAGQTPIGFTAPIAAVSHIKDGRLRALAGTGTKRLEALPDLPTMAEAGYPEIEGVNWYGFLVPAGTPRQIVTALSRETVKIVAMPETKARLATIGIKPVGSSPEEFAERIEAELPKWRKLIRAAGIRPG